MPRFYYKAVAPGGKLEEGQMDGSDEFAVVRALQSAGYLPVRAWVARRLPWPLSRQRAKSAALSPRQLLRFTHDVALLLRAGLSLDVALQLVGGVTEDAGQRQLVGDLKEALRNGASLSAALDARGGAFPGFYIALVRAGEAGGNLERALTRLHDYLERSEALRQSLRSALLYPALLAGVALLSVVALLVFVVPQFGQLLADSGQPPPAAAAFVLSASEQLRLYGLPTLGLLVLAGLLAPRYFAQPERRAALDRRLLTLPVAGPLVRRLEVARFTRALGTLMQNGVPLLAGVATAGEVFSNRAFSSLLPSLIERLKQGQGMAAPMQASGLIPGLAVQLIGIGEESGQLDAMLLRTADVLDSEFKQRVQRLIVLLEPGLIVVLGLIVAGILVSILSAILSMNDLAL